MCPLFELKLVNCSKCYRPANFDSSCFILIIANTSPVAFDRSRFVIEPIVINNDLLLEHFNALSFNRSRFAPCCH